MITHALPGPILWVAKVLPFRWVYAFPAELLMGKTASGSEALSGIAWQVVWLLGIFVGFRGLWKAAVKRYAAVSG